MLPESAPKDLAVYRLQKARAMLADAKLLYDADQWASANNRAYYSLFHGILDVPISGDKDAVFEHNGRVAERKFCDTPFIFDFGSATAADSAPSACRPC